MAGSLTDFEALEIGVRLDISCPLRPGDALRTDRYIVSRNLSSSQDQLPALSRQACTWRYRRDVWSLTVGLRAGARQRGAGNLRRSTNSQRCKVSSLQQPEYCSGSFSSAWYSQAHLSLGGVSRTIAILRGDLLLRNMQTDVISSWMMCGHHEYYSASTLCLFIIAMIQIVSLRQVVLCFITTRTRTVFKSPSSTTFPKVDTGLPPRSTSSKLLAYVYRPCESIDKHTSAISIYQSDRTAAHRDIPPWSILYQSVLRSIPLLPVRIHGCRG